MNVFRLSERFMAMDEATWARHANPWSVITRFSVLPLLALAVWCRIWLGWGALAPLAVAIWWTWWNPRAFGPPASFDNWCSRGVMGERIFLTHPHEVPAHHFRAAHVLAWAVLPGLLVMVWGLWVFWWEGVVFGMILAALPKVWFVDRMVWILQDWRQAGRALPGEM